MTLQNYQDAGVDYCVLRDPELEFAGGNTQQTTEEEDGLAVLPLTSSTHTPFLAWVSHF
jgi:hypothetical protein